jgi:hypothetical protein
MFRSNNHKHNNILLRKRKALPRMFMRCIIGQFCFVLFSFRHISGLTILLSLFFRRVLVATFAGCCAGTLAIESWKGFIVYLLANVLFSALQFATFRFKSDEYFDTTIHFFTDGLFSGLLVRSFKSTGFFSDLHVFHSHSYYFGL